MPILGTPAMPRRILAFLLGSVLLYGLAVPATLAQVPGIPALGKPAAPASFAWYDAQTNAPIPGSELVIPITKKSASATTIIRIPEGSAFRMTLKMTQGRQISILAPSRISISGITVRAQNGV